MVFYYGGFRPFVVIIPPNLLYIPRIPFHLESSGIGEFMWCIRRFPPRRGLLSEIISFSRRLVLILGFFYAILIFGS